MELVVTTGSISRAKLQSDHYHQQTNIQFFLQAGCPSCRQTNGVRAPNGKMSHPMDLLTPNSPGGLPTLSLNTSSSWFRVKLHDGGYISVGVCLTVSNLWKQRPWRRYALYWVPFYSFHCTKASQYLPASVTDFLRNVEKINRETCFGSANDLWPGLCSAGSIKPLINCICDASSHCTQFRLTDGYIRCWDEYCGQTWVALTT